MGIVIGSSGQYDRVRDVVNMGGFGGSDGCDERGWLWWCRDASLLRKGVMAEAGDVQTRSSSVMDVVNMGGSGGSDGCGEHRWLRWQ